MATALDQIVNVQITQETQAVPQAGFGIPLIVGPTGFDNSDVLRYYSSPQAMLADGFTTSDPEYIYAVEAFEQALSPTQVGIGKRTTAVAQVDTLAVSTLSTTHLYTLQIDLVVVSYQAVGGDTQQVILAGLLADIATVFPSGAPVTGVVTGTGSGALLTLTASVPGNGVSYSAIDADLTHVAVTPNHGIADDLLAIIDVPNIGNLWYGLALCSNTDADILQAASFIETLQKIFIAASADSAIATTSTTDLASILHGKGYKRTALVFSLASANMGMDAAWLGGQLPQVPGASTWKFKQLAGISPDSYTAAKKAILTGVPGISTGKTVNIYETVGGVNITEEGWMVGGQFIDITVGIDWLVSTMQANVYANLVNNPKIPYTDKGVAVIKAAVQQTLKQGSDEGGTGLIDATSISISVVPVSSIPANTRAERILPANSIVFSCRLTGAFHFIVINGIVTV